jgi:hypothetical protein
MTSELGIVIIFATTIIIWWISFLKALLKDQQGNTFIVLIQNNTLLYVTVAIFTIFSAVTLSLFKYLTPEVAAILSGIAGYVLGSINKKGE